MNLKLYNSLSSKKETFRPLSNKKVKTYGCGPTVYNDPHIGNFRTFVFYDLLNRVLKMNGYNTVTAVNITDIDDKIICLLYTSPSPRDGLLSRMPSSA